MQAFNTRNVVGDFLYTVYKEDGITVDYCPNYGYLEIFGLTDKQFNDLLDKKSYLGEGLKTFNI